MSTFGKIVRQSLPILLLCIFGEILAGVFLINIKIYLSVLPGLLILIPGIMGTRGSILGIISSRMTTGLHIGSILPQVRKNSILKTNIKTGLFLSLLVSFVTGVAAHFGCIAFGFESMGALRFILISLMTGLMADSFLMLISIFISFYAFRKNIDPDNILLPIVTTISDFTSILFLLLSIYLVQILV